MHLFFSESAIRFLLKLPSPAQGGDDVRVVRHSSSLSFASMTFKTDWDR